MAVIMAVTAVGGERWRRAVAAAVAEAVTVVVAAVAAVMGWPDLHRLLIDRRNRRFIGGGVGRRHFPHYTIVVPDLLRTAIFHRDRTRPSTCLGQTLRLHVLHVPDTRHTTHGARETIARGGEGGGWRVVRGRWWLVVGGWWLVVGEWWVGITLYTGGGRELPGTLFVVP